MAGGGSGEEENYWPGYVDALTTMTMVLTFIMMILGVVIFSMSQNISKELVKQIAEAAQIEIKGGGNAEDAKNQVIAAIKASKAEKEEISDPSQATQHNMRGENHAMPAPSTLPSSKTKLPSPAQAQQEQHGGAMAGTAGTDQPKAVESDRRTAPPPSTIDKDPAKAESDKRIDSAKVNDVPEKASGITVSDGGAILTIVFKKRVVLLDEPAINELNRVVATSPPVQSARLLEIRGYADVTVLGVTEARRIAYYRAMLIRKQLVAAGIVPERLSVKIEDAPAADSDTVRVFAK